MAWTLHKAEKYSSNKDAFKIICSVLKEEERPCFYKCDLRFLDFKILVQHSRNGLFYPFFLFLSLLQCVGFFRVVCIRVQKSQEGISSL